MTILEALLLALCVVLLFLPPRYDPAIRWKERLQQEVDRRIGPAAVCVRDGHDWRHIGGRNAGCALGRDCSCSVPVYGCGRCGDCDYGDNREAGETIARCEADRIGDLLDAARNAHPAPMRHRTR